MKPKVTTEVSAGGIVFKRTRGNIFIAFILDPFNKWTFAKGHVEKGEKSELAALREVEEEMGASGLKIIGYLGKIDFWFTPLNHREANLTEFKKHRAAIHKFVYYYLMEAPEDAAMKPQEYEKIQDIKWIQIDKALKFSSYKDAENVLKKAITILKGN